MRQTWLADELRKWGVTVIEDSGWTERGSATFGPQGVVDHHTAGPATGDAPSLRICIHGRADLPGPLCHIVLARSGIAHVIAAGRANHAGAGGWKGLSGNTTVFGIEAENTGVGEPWSDAQLEAYARCNAALISRLGKDSGWVCGHKEWAPRRKIDPAGIDMNWMRGRVNELLVAGGGGTVTPPPPVVVPVPQPTWRPEQGPTLEKGEFGPYVKAWQTKLNKYAGQHLTLDGYFGNDTVTATVNFQKFFSLVADGIVGPNTVGMMDALIAQQQQPRPTLKQGDKGPYVRELQNKLNRVAGAGLWEDGNFGSKTHIAVCNFQRFFGLGVDGIVGPKTWDTINYILANSGK